MIWLSILLVFGTLALIGVNLGSQSPELGLGAGLIIRGRTPWILLAALWGGVALGVVSLFRGRRLAKLGVLLGSCASLVVGGSLLHLSLRRVRPIAEVRDELAIEHPASG